MFAIPNASDVHEFAIKHNPGRMGAMKHEKLEMLRAEFTAFILKQAQTESKTEFFANVHNESESLPHWFNWDKKNKTLYLTQELWEDFSQELIQSGYYVSRETQHKGVVLYKVSASPRF